MWPTIDGPDEPILEARPAQQFYVSVDSSLSLSCEAEGFPPPTVEWAFGGQTLSGTDKGILNLPNVQTTQGGIYTCTLFNELTEAQRQKNLTLNIYGVLTGVYFFFMQNLPFVAYVARKIWTQT